MSLHSVFIIFLKNWKNRACVFFFFSSSEYLKSMERCIEIVTFLFDTKHVTHIWWRWQNTEITTNHWITTGDDIFVFFSVLHRLKNPPKMWLFCLPQSKSQTQMCIISYPSRWFYLTLNRSNCYSDLLITSCVPIKLQIQSFKPEHFEQQRIMYYLILRYFKTCRKNITASRLYWEIKLVILKISWLKPPEILKLKLILVVCSSEHIA